LPANCAVAYDLLDRSKIDDLRASNAFRISGRPGAAQLPGAGANPS